jgi:hypothetical protein
MHIVVGTDATHTHHYVGPFTTAEQARVAAIRLNQMPQAEWVIPIQWTVRKLDNIHTVWTNLIVNACPTEKKASA